MIPEKAQRLFEQVAREAGISTREAIEEFAEPGYLLETQSVANLERRLRYFFGLPLRREVVMPRRGDNGSRV